MIINFSLEFDLGRVFLPSLHGDLYVYLQVVIFSPLSIFCFFVGWSAGQISTELVWRMDFLNIIRWVVF